MSQSSAELAQEWEKASPVLRAAWKAQKEASGAKDSSK
jgi:hypothetical protein